MTRFAQSLRLALLATILAAAGQLRAADTVQSAQFLPQLATDLAAHFGANGELQLDLLRSWAPPVSPKGDWSLTIVAPPQALASQMIVRVRVIQAGRALGEWNLPLRAQLWADAFVTRQPVARGEPLDLALFDLRRVDFLREKDTVPAATDLSQLSVSRSIAAGATLSWRDVARRQLVQRGDRIDVVASSGALVITMKALAMQGGALGETIVVRNPESRRDFSAVVTAENQARVTF
ncbi:MAG TPA: flagellar basal body P-ring formation chaperone FlgA [Opitutaceae bacterium]|nr:flagellar basal body P-ring formation chaperone FlgA [Opitutaceae bacterium]